MSEPLRTPPRGLGILLLVGPAFIWSAEYIGTGEVLLATRAGAVLGTAILWAVVLGILLKYWIGMAGARYTACTGEGMMDLFDRVPGPRHWAVWIVLVVQLFAGALSIGAVATAAGAFLNRLVPALPGSVAGWLVAGFAFVVAWTGAFDLLKGVMTFFVLLIVGGALYAAVHVFPGAGRPRPEPGVPAAGGAGLGARAGRAGEPLARDHAAARVGRRGLREPGLVHVLGARARATASRRGAATASRPTCDALGRMTRAAAEKMKGWCHVVYVDATIALVIGVVVTGAFVLSGAGVLRPLQLVPKGDGVEMAGSIASIFSSQWGAIGGTLFLVAAIAALVGTLLGQLAGWPRLLADAFRLAVPAVHRRFEWRTQFRFFLVLFFCTNMIVVYVMQKNPIGIVRTAAVLDGILLTALQAIWVGVGLYVVLPRLLSKEAWEVLRPSPVFALGLAAGAAVFGWLTVTEAIPQILAAFGGAQ